MEKIKRVIAQLELNEDRGNQKVFAFQNLIVIGEGQQGYKFYIQIGDQLKQLFIRGVEIIEVAEIDGVVEILLEQEITKPMAKSSATSH